MRSQQALAETAERVDGAKLRPLVRDRWHETGPSAGAKQHPQAGAGAWCRVQSFADPAESDRSGEAPAVTGVLFAAFYAFPARFCMVWSNAPAGEPPVPNFALQSSQLYHPTSAAPSLRGRLKTPTSTTDCYQPVAVVAVFQAANPKQIT